MFQAQAVVKNIVLVQGAFAGSSSWSKVIPLLQEMGYHAVGAEPAEPSHEVEYREPAERTLGYGTTSAD